MGSKLSEYTKMITDIIEDFDLTNYFAVRYCDFISADGFHVSFKVNKINIDRYATLPKTQIVLDLDEDGKCISFDYGEYPFTRNGFLASFGYHVGL